MEVSYRKQQYNQINSSHHFGQFHLYTCVDVVCLHRLDVGTYEGMCKHHWETLHCDMPGILTQLADPRRLIFLASS